MNIFYCYNLLLLFNTILLIHSQNVDKNQLCNTKETCSECIQENGCIWCSKFLESTEPGTNSQFSRCIAESMKTPDWCPEGYITNPQPDLKIKKDLPLKSATKLDDPVVQIRPQRVQLKLRRNQEYKLKFQYSQAIDYPVDLYYLMDLSSSMGDDLQNLYKLGDSLAATMKALTKNFRLGFGSFVEKVTMPFVSPTRCKDASCPVPYSFKNHLPLDMNTALFKTEVGKAHVSGNLDSPEGGFDAILQSIVCQKEIGWRENATRLLVFSTDASSHYAGDGKLAGIIEPHDGGCYLNDKGEYTHALKFDYPSISFINRHVKKHNIDLLFAVTKDVQTTYQNLAKRIAGSQVGVLDKDSLNVVSLVNETYHKLKKSIVIIDNAGPDVNIEYFTACLEGPEVIKTKNCSDIRYNKAVNFTAVISVTSCQQRNHVIEIKPRSLSESLIVEIEVDCDCDCERAGHEHFEANAPQCTAYGSLACGVCLCNPGRAGKFCECDDDLGLLTSNDMNSCKVSNKTDDVVCSGNGRCKCGKCICNKGRRPGEEYSGAYCQCDNFSCKKPYGKLCSGHGTCECKQCICDRGFNGTACECDTRNDNCIEPKTNEVCSGKGTCNCGKCACQTHPIQYWGQYCEMCSDCPGQRCSEFRDCVECQVFPNSGKYSIEECHFHCTNFSTVPINDIQEVVSSESDNQNYKICESPDNNGCTMLFKYSYDGNKQIPKVYVQKDKKCPAKVALLPIMLLVIGTIVLAGLIILAIWKIATEVHDRREYVQFEKERQNAKFDRGENPLFKAATTTVTNPLFDNN